MSVPMVGQLVDTPAAVEFMSEIAARLPAGDVAAVTAKLDAKSEAFSRLLCDGHARDIDPDTLRRVLRSVFPARRRAAKIVESVGAGRLGEAIDDLLSGKDALDERVERLDVLLSDYPEAAADLPWELLHLTQPERYWLWSRWIWDPRTGTGALPLVTAEEVDLHGGDRVGTYTRVGEAMAMVSETGSALGFFGEGPFDADVFLACVYGVYMYTVLRMRMTQEFNRIVPELPALIRRLLGVHHPEV